MTAPRRVLSLLLFWAGTTAIVNVGARDTPSQAPAKPLDSLPLSPSNSQIRESTAYSFRSLTSIQEGLANSNRATVARTYPTVPSPDDKGEVYCQLTARVESIEFKLQVATIIASFRCYWLNPDPNWVTSNATAMDRRYLPLSPNPNAVFYGTSTGTDFVNYFRYNSTTSLVTWFRNFKAKVNQPMNLHKYPFDRQVLMLPWKFKLDRWDVLLNRPDWVPESVANQGNSTFRAYFEASALEAGFELKGISAMRAETNHPSMKNKTPFYVYYIEIERSPPWYLINFILPFFISVGILTVSFIFSSLVERIAAITAVFFVVVGFKISISATLPPSSTLNVMDLYLLSIYLTLTAIAVYHITMELYWGGIANRPLPIHVSKTSKDPSIDPESGDPEKATLIQREDVATYKQLATDKPKTRRLFPFVATADLIAGMIFISLWVLAHIVIGVAVDFGWFRESWEDTIDWRLRFASPVYLWPRP